jgi:hypothetical protein
MRGSGPELGWVAATSEPVFGRIKAIVFLSLLNDLLLASGGEV